MVARRIQDPVRRYDMEFTAYKHSGLFLCLLGGTYLLVCLRMYFMGDATLYGGYIVYLVAAVAFTKLGLAIYGAVIARHLKSPIVTTLKIFSFTDAMVSIVVTQCTLLTMQSQNQAIHSSAVLGIGFSALFVLMGVCMLCKKRRDVAKESAAELRD